MSRKIEPLNIQVLQLSAEIAALRTALCTAIAWIGASAGSPLSVNDCKTLIKMAEGKSNLNE